MKMQFFFGNKTTAFSKKQSIPISNNVLLQQESCNKIARILNAKKLLFLEQIHASYGHIITSNNAHMQAFSLQGDFLITDQIYTGLAVLTADCTPVIAYDRQKSVIGIAHAGWKGAVNGVFQNMIQAMCKKYDCNTTTIQLFFGPSARSCCYEIKEEVLVMIDVKKCLQQGSVVKKQHRYFFDTVTYVRQLCIALNIAYNKIDITNALCTICNLQYCSYRRTNKSALRNISAVCITR